MFEGPTVKPLDDHEDDHCALQQVTVTHGIYTERVTHILWREQWLNGWSTDPDGTRRPRTV